MERGAGNYEQARILVEKAHALTSEDDHATLGRIFHVFAQFESDHDRWQEALSFCQRSLKQYQKAGNKNRIAHATRHIADLQTALDDFENAEQNYRASIAIYNAAAQTNPGDLANALAGFGRLLSKIGKADEAISVWEKTKALYQQVGLQAGVDEAEQRLQHLKGKNS